MLKNKPQMFCSSHHMLITLRTADESGNQIGLCNLCRRERAKPEKTTTKKSRSGPQVVIQENMRELYSKLDELIVKDPSTSNNKIAEQLGVDSRTVARRRRAIGMGSSKAGRLPEEIARRILEIQNEAPSAPVAEIARKAGCSRGSVSSVLENPEHYIRASEDN